MPEDLTVTLEPARADQARLLGRLLELYLHDLSDVFAIQVGPDGRFGYEHLPRYFEEADRRFAFLLRAGSGLAGFALVKRGSEATDDPTDLDLAEFFVLRGLRRSGIGRRAAFALFDRIPGSWVVRVADANRRGLPFWRAVVPEYTRGRFVHRKLPGPRHVWNVFTFQSPPGP
jgi:predicted acetyltransferase